MKYAVAISQYNEAKKIFNKVYIVDAPNSKEAIAEAKAEAHTFYQSQYSAEDWTNRKEHFKSNLLRHWQDSKVESIIGFYQQQKQFISKPIKL